MFSALVGTGVLRFPGTRAEVNESTGTESADESSVSPEDVNLCDTGVHYPIRIMGTPATCEKDGVTDKIYCEKCRSVLKDAEVLPALCHENRQVLEILTGAVSGLSFPAQFHCPDCNANFIDSLKPADFHMPIVSVRGDTGSADKGLRTPVATEYYGETESFQCDATLRIQGQSSSLFPIKNYALKLYKSGTNQQKKQNVELFEGCKENEYCLKANYMDASQARNIVGARIYKEISETRNNGDPISKTKTQCVIDGFPVLFYVNGAFHGLYTLNIPKDHWVYEMKKSPSTRQAALFSRHVEPNNYLRTHISFENYDWKIEFASTEDEPAIGTDWAVNSINNMADTLNTLDDARLKKVLPTVVNVDRAIDALLYTIFIGAYDNRVKNILYLTYDGTQWAPVMYDMDSAFGLNFDGTAFYNANFPYQNFTGNGSVLYQKIFKLYNNEFKARYKELRKTILTYEHIDAEFKAFFDSIPDICYETNFRVNPGIPQQKVNHYEQIMSFVKGRLDYLDSVFQ